MSTTVSHQLDGAAWTRRPSTTTAAAAAAAADDDDDDGGGGGGGDGDAGDMAWCSVACGPVWNCIIGSKQRLVALSLVINNSTHSPATFNFHSSRHATLQCVRGAGWPSVHGLAMTRPTSSLWCQLTLVVSMSVAQLLYMHLPDFT